MIGVKIRVARKAPVIAFLMAFFLLSACGSLATCGCNEPVDNDQKLIQEASNNEFNSTAGTIVKVTPIIPHMRFKIIRPEYDEVIAVEEGETTTTMDLLAVTSIDSCHGDVCTGYQIKSVEFYEGLNKLGEAAKEGGNTGETCLWKLSWPFDPGTYNLTAKAIDSKNRIETSSPVTFTVKPFNIPPQAVFTRPYDNETFTYPATILINVSAWDKDDNITRVEIFEGMNKLNESEVICRSQPQQNCTYNFIWENASPRIYSLKAIAVDEEGATGTSSPLTIVVKPNEVNGDLEQSTGTKPPHHCNFRSQPDIATLVSPNDTVGTYNPTYTWNSVHDSTSYRLMVNSSTGNVINELYDAANLMCPDQRCSVKPSEPSQTLAIGSYKWWIQTSNCKGDGPWSSNMSFKITGQPPSAPQPISPNGLVGTSTPTFTWTASPGSTQYNIQVQDEAGGSIIDEIYEADEVTSGYNCSAISPRSLWNGIFYWGVGAKNEFDGGSFTTIDFKNTSSTPYFEVVCTIPKNASNQINDYIQSISDDAFQVDPVEYKAIISEKLGEATASIDSKEYQGAINRLMFVRSKADGAVDGDKEDDWITDPAAQNEICKMIDNLIVDIKAVQSSNKRTQSSNELTDIRERPPRQNR